MNIKFKNPLSVKDDLQAYNSMVVNQETKEEREKISKKIAVKSLAQVAVTIIATAASAYVITKLISTDEDENNES